MSAEFVMSENSRKWQPESILPEARDKLQNFVLARREVRIALYADVEDIAVALYTSAWIEISKIRKRMLN